MKALHPHAGEKKISILRSEESNLHVQIRDFSHCAFNPHAAKKKESQLLSLNFNLYLSNQLPYFFQSFLQLRNIDIMYIGRCRSENLSCCYTDCFARHQRRRHDSQTAVSIRIRRDTAACHQNILKTNRRQTSERNSGSKRSLFT